MAANLFELLNAPTSLKPKDLSTHIRMQMALPEEVRNTCTRDLFRMDIKLFNELTTCRYSRKLPKEDDPGYQAFCEEIGVKGVEPIPYRFFASEYAAVTAGDKDAKKAVAAISEPWRVQAYAAQYLRMAQNAETGKPESAGSLWLKAIRQYKKFFSVAKVEESYTYQYAADDEAKQLCVETWDGFIKKLLEDLNARRREYINKQNAKSAEVCLKVLSYKEVQAIAPDAYSNALKESFAPYITAIKSAATLQKAGEMYKNCPEAMREADEECELELAMLSAIAAEVSRRKAVKEPANDVPVWLKKLKVKDLHENGAVMVKIEADAVYQACAEYIRFALEDKKEEIVLCACRICSTECFPDDVVVGQGSDGDLFRPDVAPILAGNYASIMANNLPSRITASNAASLAKKLKAVCNDLGRDVSTYAAITTGVNYLGSHDAGENVILAFLNEFDAATPLKDESCPTVGELKKRIEGDPGIKLLKKLADTDCGSSSYPGVVNEVISYLNKHGSDVVNGEKLEDIARKLLINEFVACANRYQSNQSQALLQTLKKLAGWLKYTTEVPAGDQHLTVGDVMKSIQGNPELEAFKKVQEASTGSMDENKAVQALIALARTKGSTEVQGTTILELAQNVLLSVYVRNANAYQSGGGNISRSTMHTIADWLPYYTEVPGGDGTTVREFDNRLEPLRVLPAIRDRVQNDTFTESDIGCLAYFIENWPDFDLGGQSFKDVARSFLHAMLVTCANGLQRSGRYSGDHWDNKMAALFSVISTFGSTVSEQEGKALMNIVQHYGVSTTGRKPSYSPDYPPFKTDEKPNKRRGGFGSGGRSGGGRGSGSYKKPSGARRFFGILLLLAAIAALAWGVMGFTSRTVRVYGGDAKGVYDLVEDTFDGTARFTKAYGKLSGGDELRKLAETCRVRQRYIGLGGGAVVGIAAILLLRKKRR